MVDVKYKLEDGTIVTSQVKAKESGQKYEELRVETQIARPEAAPAEIGPVEQFIRESEYAKKIGHIERGVIALYDEETIKEVYAKQKEWAVETARWNASNMSPAVLENAVKCAEEVTERNLAFMLLAHKAMTDDEAFEQLMIRLEQQSRDIAQQRADAIDVSSFRDPSEAAVLRNMYFETIDKDVEKYRQYWSKIRTYAA